MNYRFLTRDHPEANGRMAGHGERQFSVTFPIEGEVGEALVVNLGWKGFCNLAALIQNLVDSDPQLVRDVAAIRIENTAGNTEGAQDAEGE